MARRPRLVVPNCPHHVTQRGNRKQQTFFTNEDFRAYINLIRKAKDAANVEIWAYCLMPNHIHMIVVPEDVGGISRLIQHPHRRYAWRINQRMGWQGHLWQERYHSFPMDESHVVAAVRYVELNPVRAGLCKDPREWRWSSVHAHLGTGADPLVDIAPFTRQIANWLSYLSAGVDQYMLRALREHTRSGLPAGDESFVCRLESITGRRLTKSKPGPQKVAGARSTRKVARKSATMRPKPGI